MTLPFAVEVTFEHGPQRPTRVPVLPGLNVGRSYYDCHSYGGTPKRYRSAGPDAIAISDGPDLFNQVLMGDGVWYLQAGDRPALRLAHRPYWPNSYIKPDLIPGLGIAGDLYFAALTGGGEVPSAATPLETHIRTRAAATHAAHTYGLEPDIPPEFDLQWELPPLPPRYEPLPGLPFHAGARGQGH